MTIESHNRHFVLSKGTCLVRTNFICTAHRLTRVIVFNQIVFCKHLFYRVCQ
jgi:hypothetical protein